MSRVLLLVILVTIGWFVARALINRSRLEAARKKNLERPNANASRRTRRQKDEQIRDATFRDIDTSERKR